MADKLAREHALATADYRDAWERFGERFGRTGRPARDYYCVEVGHILHLRPSDLGDVKPLDLLHAAEVFDALYRRDDG